MRPGDHNTGVGTTLIVGNALIVVALLLSPLSLRGQELRGSIFAETRIFPSNPAFPDQDDATLSPSLGLEPEFSWESDSGALQLTFTPFLRWDAKDDNRTHFDIREASALYLADGWTLFAGVGKVFWGTTEARHLVDIINQTDGVEDIDTEDKLGQPMVNFTLEREWGAIDLFFMPYFRDRTFPDGRARLRGPVPTLEDAIYERGDGFDHPDLAVRWSFYTGNLDVAVSGFRGLSREPRLSPALQPDDAVRLQATYDVIDQISIDAQWTRGPTLWKLEAMTRGGHDRRIYAAVLGLEHTLFSLGPGAADLGLLAEYMIDDRTEAAPFTPFDHDVFLGARWAFNDTADTSILGGPVVDYETGEIFAFLEAERRFGDRWIAGLEARWLANTEAGGPVHGLRRDDFMTLRLSRYF